MRGTRRKNVAIIERGCAIGEAGGRASAGQGGKEGDGWGGPGECAAGSGGDARRRATFNGEDAGAWRAGTMSWRSTAGRSVAERRGGAVRCQGGKDDGRCQRSSESSSALGRVRVGRGGASGSDAAKARNEVGARSRGEAREREARGGQGACRAEGRSRARGRLRVEDCRLS